MGMLITILEQLGLMLLGHFFQSAAVVAKQQGIDANALQAISDLVESAEQNSTLKDGASKFGWVEEQSISYLRDHEIDISLSLLHSLIALAVHHNLHGADAHAQ